jgi:hypothetical protein
MVGCCSEDCEPNGMLDILAWLYTNLANVFPLRIRTFGKLRPGSWIFSFSDWTSYTWLSPRTRRMILLFAGSLLFHAVPESYVDRSVIWSTYCTIFFLDAIFRVAIDYLGSPHDNNA